MNNEDRKTTIITNEDIADTETAAGNKRQAELENFKISVQQLRQYISERYEPLPIEMQALLKETLELILKADKELIEAAEGDIMMLLLLLEEREKTYEVAALINEARLRIIRLLKDAPRILRGKDNTDLFKDKRDADGYIVDLTLLKPPYSVQRIIHRDNPNTEYTEEIYCDSLGRYFRKIYDFVEKEETEDAIAADILSNFTDDTSCDTCNEDQ